MIKQERPETEMGYWELIESIGGYIWHTNHDASHGRIHLTAEDKARLNHLQELNNQLVDELFELFGVVHPKNCPQIRYDGPAIPVAPPGMIWYWDWYGKMKSEFKQAEYEKIICSACALCEGIDIFIQGNWIPCTVYRGIIYTLSRPYQCAMLDDFPSWDETKLFTEIKKIGGEEAISRFKTKEFELKATA